MVACQLERAIIDAGWPVGTILGSEDELRRRFEVSWPVMRRAIRILEQRQIVVVRKGAHGGLEVRAPAWSAVVAMLDAYLAFARVTTEELLEARRHIETIAAELAVQRGRELGIRQLRRVSASLTNEDVVDWNVARRLVESVTGNRMLAVFVAALGQACDGRAISYAVSYRPVVDAVLEGDVRKAVEGVELAISESIPNRPVRRPVTGERLDDELAWTIRNDIGRRRLRPGHLVGTQVELLRRFEAGPVVLRQAVRILEHHGIARARTGPGGGLIVTAPDPTAAADAASLYLDYLGISADDLIEVWIPLEVAIVDLTMARMTPAKRRSLSGGPHGAAPNVSGKFFLESDIAYNMHQLFARMTDNHVLELLAASVTGSRPVIWWRSRSQTRRPTATSASSTQFWPAMPRSLGPVCARISTTSGQRWPVEAASPAGLTASGRNSVSAAMQRPDPPQHQ